MSPRKKTRTCRACDNRPGGYADCFLDLIEEEPLLIRIDDKPYAVVMRTPGDEVCHAAGFCLGEGIIAGSGDYKTIGYDEHQDPNVVDVWLRPERRKKIHERLDRRVYVSQTSCGICGKEMIKDLCQRVTPVKSDFSIDKNRIFTCLDKLVESQNHYQTTRCSHAALLLDETLQEIAFAEDVGRHNALDKAIGKALTDRRLSEACVVVLSSRNSYELVQKSARARIPLMISNSRPTALAVEMGNMLGMTLVFPYGENEIIILCGAQRIKNETR